MKPYILDHDGSGDDYSALMLLNSQPETVAIKGITIAATGESVGELGAQNTAAFCHKLGLNEVPIAYGSKTPISKDFLAFPDFIFNYTTNILMKDKPLKPHPRPTITDNAV